MVQHAVQTNNGLASGCGAEAKLWGLWCTGKLLAPAFGDHLVFTLAKFTGWSDEYLRHRVSFARLLKLYHCALYAEGAWTVPRGIPKNQQFEQLQAFASTVTQEDEDDE